MQTALTNQTEADVRLIPLADSGGVPEVGAKAARLGALMARGERVPDGFCLIGRGEAAVKLAIEAYRRMGLEVAVAVRSSASAEDGSESSFAGQFETVLNVRGEPALAAALVRCWESVSAGRVEAYFRRRGLEDLAGRMVMSVLVQRMVDARAAGVAFSADPLSGVRDVVVINAVRGLGDAVVSGEVTPDHFSVSGDGGVVKRSRDPADPALEDEEARAIAVMVRRVEAQEGAPQDVEWALDGTGLWLLQARPMTALPDRVEWESPVAGAKWIKDLQAAEWATEPLSPLAATTTFEAMAVAREQWRGWPPVPRSYEPGHTLINGWLYMRMGGPPLSYVANILGSMLTLLAGRLDGHRRVEQSWGQHLSQLDWLQAAQPRELEVEARRRRVDQLLEALGWWWCEVSWFAAMVRVNQMLIGQARPPGLAEPGVLFRGNDSLLLESQRALRRAAQDPAQVDPYLDRFGDFVESADPIHPTLRESPEHLTWQLAAARATREDPDERLRRHRQERAQAEEVVRAMKGRRGFVAKRALASGQSHAAHTDDAVFHFQRVLAMLRGAFLEEGRRLAEAGVIDAAGDVFFLERDELWKKGGDLRPLVEGRRELRERRKRLAAPPMIPPATDPAWAADPVLKRAPAEFRAQLVERGAGERDGRRVLVGTPASPGTARGIARVVEGPADFARFEPGDVLVAHATSPIWTPLLAVAAAAVTEVGGPFAHAAIVAREFGIPLVDGAIDATRIIADGSAVVVDGSAGLVDY